jgi:hypothetical protein
VHKIRGGFASPAPFIRLAPLAILLMFAFPLDSRADSAPVISRALRLADTAPSPIAQDAPDDDDDKEVPPSQLEKYISAYKQMQKDHNLTADQAASKQGLTIAEFRSLEGRIERDDVLRERVRKALRNATPGSKESAD